MTSVSGIYNHNTNTMRITPRLNDTRMIRMQHYLKQVGMLKKKKEMKRARKCGRE